MRPATCLLKTVSNKIRVQNVNPHYKKFPSDITKIWKLMELGNFMMSDENTDRNS